MRKINTVVTLVLAAVATLSWAYVIYYTVRWVNPPTCYMVLAVSFSVLACVGWVLLSLPETHGDIYPRCRHCGYILRGLSEPRCPECGTPI